MQQKYVYSHNGVWNFFRALIPWQRGSKLVYPARNPAQTYVWRNSYTEGFKVGLAYTDQPLDMTNYLFIRTGYRRLFTPRCVLTATQRAQTSKRQWIVSCRSAQRLNTN